jgi:predicted Zn-dependent peptidase
MENNQNITEFYGKQFLLEKFPIITVEQYLDEISKVTANDVLRVCRNIFKPEMMNVSSIGDVTEQQLKPYIKEQMKKWRNYLS